MWGGNDLLLSVHNGEVSKFKLRNKLGISNVCLHMIVHVDNNNSIF